MSSLYLDNKDKLFVISLCDFASECVRNVLLVGGSVNAAYGRRIDTANESRGPLHAHISRLYTCTNKMECKKIQ